MTLRFMPCIRRVCSVAVSESTLAEQAWLCGSCPGFGQLIPSCVLPVCKLGCFKVRLFKLRPSVCACRWPSGSKPPEDELFRAGESASHMTFVLSGHFHYQPGARDIAAARSRCPDSHRCYQNPPEAQACMWKVRPGLVCSLCKTLQQM